MAFSLTKGLLILLPSIVGIFSTGAAGLVPNKRSIPGAWPIRARADSSTFDCSNVGSSPGGQPCANSGGGELTCNGLYEWSCPNGDSGAVPPGTICACSAFRHPDWHPSPAGQPACTSGIYCYTEDTFGVCGPGGIEPAQPVATGTKCVEGNMAYTSGGESAPTGKSGSSANPACTSGIYCYSEDTFGVCGPDGAGPVQSVAAGTRCVDGKISYSYAGGGTNDSNATHA